MRKTAEQNDRMIEWIKNKSGPVLIPLIALLVGGFAIIGSINTPKTQTTPAYTTQQIKSAEEFIQLLLRNRMVTEYKGEGGRLIAYVDRRMWNIGTFENKKTILKTLSQANETRGNTPHIEIRDHRSGKVYGEVGPATFKVYE